MWLFGKWWRSVWICIYDLSTISELKLIEFHDQLCLVAVGPESDDLPAGWFFVWRSPSSVCSCWLSPQPLDRLQHFSLPPSHTGTSLYLKKKLTKIRHVFFFLQNIMILRLRNSLFFYSFVTIGILSKEQDWSHLKTEIQNLASCLYSS